MHNTTMNLFLVFTSLARTVPGLVVFMFIPLKTIIIMFFVYNRILIDYTGNNVTDQYREGRDYAQLHGWPYNEDKNDVLYTHHDYTMQQKRQNVQKSSCCPNLTHSSQLRRIPTDPILSSSSATSTSIRMIVSSFLFVLLRFNVRYQASNKLALAMASQWLKSTVYTLNLSNLL